MPAIRAPLPTTAPNAVGYTATFITFAALVIIVWVAAAIAAFWWMPRRNAAFRRAEDRRLGFHLTIRPASDESWGNSASGWGHNDNHNIHIIKLQTIDHTPAPETAVVEV